MTTARLVFAGTTEFAAAILDTLLRGSGHEVIAVYTQPDRPAGRGRQPHSCPVKQLALAHSVKVLQPDGLRDPAVLSEFASFRPDLLIVAAYGLLLPQAVLDAPRLGCLNVHASLLPRWRGAAPIQRALLAGDSETGISIMRIVAALDAGPIILQRRLPIEPSATTGSLEQLLASLGAEALQEGIAQTLAARAVAREQDPKLMCYAHKIDKADRVLHWDEPAVALERRVRALLPRPAATVNFDGIICKVLWARVLAGNDAPPGTIVNSGAAGIDVATGDGLLRLTHLHPPGKREMTAAEFIRGHALPRSAT
ncbi:MAG: methionyl-tRNA formyltransferase [Gammaproteobacteria bacterium]|nr:methionyl-tRNA formyltransferase [Gammaproteobacteria bacterium]